MATVTTPARCRWTSTWWNGRSTAPEVSRPARQDRRRVGSALPRVRIHRPISIPTMVAQAPRLQPRPGRPAHGLGGNCRGRACWWRSRSPDVDGQVVTTMTWWPLSTLSPEIPKALPISSRVLAGLVGEEFFTNPFWDFRPRSWPAAFRSFAASASFFRSLSDAPESLLTATCSQRLITPPTTRMPHHRPHRRPFPRRRPLRGRRGARETKKTGRPG